MLRREWKGVRGDVKEGWREKRRYLEEKLAVERMSGSKLSFDFGTIQRKMSMASLHSNSQVFSFQKPFNWMFFILIYI